MMIVPFLLFAGFVPALGFAQTVIPEILGLEDGDAISAEMYKKYSVNDIAVSIVQRLQKTMKDPDGTENFHALGLAPDKISWDPIRQTQLQLYFPEEFSANIREMGFLNIHQKPEISNYESRIQFRNSVEEGLARLKLKFGKVLAKSPQSPANILRPKSAILEVLLPEGQRPQVRGGIRYGGVVAILKDSVKRRVTYTPYDSGGVFSSPYTTQDRLVKEVRPLLSRNYFFRPQHPTEYFEAQIWGEVTLEDVKELWVNERISPEALEKLKLTNLDIYYYKEVTQGVERNGYYEDYHRVRSKKIVAGKAVQLRCGAVHKL